MGRVNRKYRQNKYARKIIWAKTKTNVDSYKTMGGLVRNVFKDDNNYNELVKRLDREAPGIFESPYSSLAGKKQDKQAVLEYVTEHAKQIYNDMKRTDNRATLEKALKKELNTRSYVSEEELIQNNMKTYLNHRGNKAERQRVRDMLGLKPRERIPYNDLVYNPRTKVTRWDPNDPTKIIGYDYVKAYGFRGRDVAFELKGGGSRKSPYIFELQKLDDVII